MSDKYGASQLIVQIDQIQQELVHQRNRIDELEKIVARMERSDNQLFQEVSAILREQARNTLETSRLLSDLSTEFTQAVFQLEEIKSWKNRITGVSVDWIAEHRAEQMRLAYYAIKESFNKSELRELLLNVGISESEISGDNIAEMAMYIIDYARHHGIFWRLVKEGKKMRPNTNWPSETGGFSDV